MRVINDISTWHARNCLTKTQRFNIPAMEKIKWKVARRNNNQICELNEGKYYMLCAGNFINFTVTFVFSYIIKTMNK